jgi:hypothetical protein
MGTSLTTSTPCPSPMNSASLRAPLYWAAVDWPCRIGKRSPSPDLSWRNRTRQAIPPNSLPIARRLMRSSPPRATNHAHQRRPRSRPSSRAGGRVGSRQRPTPSRSHHPPVVHHARVVPLPARLSSSRSMSISPRSKRSSDCRVSARPSQRVSSTTAHAAGPLGHSTGSTPYPVSAPRSSTRLPAA